MPDPDPSELHRFARLVQLLRSLQCRYAAGDRSDALRAQLADATRRVDRAISWILAHRQPMLRGITAKRPQNAPGAIGEAEGRITRPAAPAPQAGPVPCPHNRN
jgi:hypothetical protein